MNNTRNWVGFVECGICQHVQQARVEIDAEHEEPIIPIECNKCHSLACIAVYDDGRSFGGEDNRMINNDWMPGV